MPYPSEHSARLKAPGDFESESFRRKEISPGINIILGKLTGETTMTTQAYRFDKSQFTVEQAKAWLKEHEIKYISFEPASESTEQQGDISIPDGLEPSILAFHQRSDLNFTDDLESGDTVFHDVILIAEGTWTDGHNRKPIHYSGKELKKMKLEEQKFKASHDMFGELPITNEVGTIENMKFVTNPTPRWLGDVRVFPTQNGNDIITLLKRKAITDISSELYSIHRVKDGKTNATNIRFMGAASVRSGACSICTFNEGVEEIMTDEPAATSGAKPNEDQAAEVAALESHVNEAKSADIKALESQLEDAMKNKSSEMAVELYSSQQKIAQLEATNKELMRNVAELEHGDKVKELHRQIEALNKAPVIHTRIESGVPMMVAELDSDEFPAFSASDME